MSSTTYDVVRAAIAAKKPVRATYGGYVREMCPHAIGLGRDGHEQALFYQFGGGSRQGDAATLPEEERWRCLFIDKISDLEVIEGDWVTCDNHSHPNTCIKQLDLEVAY